MIQVKMKCRCTDGIEATIPVRERMEGEDILHYMEYLRAKVTEWHLDRNCDSIKLDHLKIPIEAMGWSEEEAKAAVEGT